MLQHESPIARTPLLSLHESAGATIGARGEWRVALKYPSEPLPGGNALVDLSHRRTLEINGPATESLLAALAGRVVPRRSILVIEPAAIYRLTDERAILFGDGPQSTEALDVTGGWASLALLGPDAERILNKVTAVDLRIRTMPPGACCQGPLLGVTTLFGRLANRIEIHVAADSAQFVWEALLDAGGEFKLTPAGLEYFEGATR